MHKCGKTQAGSAPILPGQWLKGLAPSAMLHTETPERQEKRVLMSQRRRPHIHSCIPELQEQLRQGKIDRREFLRIVTLLGMTTSAAYAMVGYLTGHTPVPSAAAAGKAGGHLRCSLRVQAMTDPATFDWGEGASHPGISHDHRARQPYASVSGRKLGGVRRPQNLDFYPPSRCPLVQRRRVYC
jgi:hypothetical protein